jgi:hypothetical protein
LLAVGSGFLPLRPSIGMRRYADILRSVTLATRRSLSFARCEDRVNIGKAVVRSARRLEF